MNDDVVRVELTDIARTALAPRAELVLPRLIVDAGPAAVEKFLEFFAARIANRRTRAAYGRAVGQCRLACWQIQLDRGRAASSGPSSRWTQRPIVVWSASRPCSLSSSSTSRNESEY